MNEKYFYMAIAIMFCALMFAPVIAEFAQCK